MPASDPDKLFADAVGLLATAACPVCGALGKPKAYIHPYAPPPACRWCAERDRVVEGYKRLLYRLKQKGPLSGADGQIQGD